MSDFDAAWVAETASTERAEARIDVPATLGCFAGHFPGQPILPGIVQVLWAQQLAERAFGFDPEGFAGLARVKFIAPVPPNSQLTLACTRTASGATFRFGRDGTTCTSGSLRYSPASAAGTP